MEVAVGRERWKEETNRVMVLLLRNRPTLLLNSLPGTTRLVLTSVCLHYPYSFLSLFLSFSLSPSLCHSLPPSLSLLPPFLPPQFRDRSATAPAPTRPTNIGGPSEGGAPPVTDYSASPQQRQSYKKQISTPEMSHPSNAPQLHHSTTFPPQDQFHGSPAGPGGSDAVRHYPSFSPAERQISEYGNFLSEMSYGTENILKQQSERFASYELEAMKKKQASPSE